MVSIAANQIQMVTFFEDLLPYADGMERILADVWKAAEVECSIDEDRTNRIDSHVLYISNIVQRTPTILTQFRSIQSWTLLHFVFEAKHYKPNLSGFY